MYDAREKALRDQQWQLNSAFREGEIRGEIELIRTLQAILCVPVSEEQQLRALSWEQVQSLAADLQERVRNRSST